jgi:hypothetical protein
MHADLAASCAPTNRLHSQRLHRIDVMFSISLTIHLFSLENPNKFDTLLRLPGHDLTSIKYTAIQPFEILPCPVTQNVDPGPSGYCVYQPTCPR